jgi:hypothetical protein
LDHAGGTVGIVLVDAFRHSGEEFDSTVVIVIYKEARRLGVL